MKHKLKSFSALFLMLLLSGLSLKGNDFNSYDNNNGISDISVPIENSKTIPSINSVLGNINKEAEKYFKMSGLIIERYDYKTQKDAYDSFSIECFRFFINGDITDDFFYKVQIEFAHTPKLLNAWIQWRKFKPFQIRAGQMYRNFGFETPYNPYYLGTSDFAQAVVKFAGFNDRIGSSASSNARDIGVLFIGDLLEYNKFNLLHYELGIFNGNGINQKDNNNNKDVIGTFYFQPYKDLLIGGSGWLGKYGPEGNTVDRKRWTAGVKYETDKYSFRSEYLYSYGKKAGMPESAPIADGWYAVAGAKVDKNVKIYLKYDAYRDDRTSLTQTNRYFISVNWELYKRIMLQATYFYTERKEKGLDNYNTVAAQLMFTF